MRCDAIFVLVEFVHISPYIKVEQGYEKNTRGNPFMGLMVLLFKNILGCQRTVTTAPGQIFSWCAGVHKGQGTASC